MAGTLLDKGWLETVVASALEHHDSGAGLGSLPEEVVAAASSPADLAPAARLLVARSLRTRLGVGPAAPHDAFLHEARLHVVLALDLALLTRAPVERGRRRAELAAFFAAAAGEQDAAVAALPGGKAPPERAVRRALATAETALLSRFHPPGDPLGGLPLHAGTVAIFRRRLARVAMGYFRDGALGPAALARHADYAVRESVLLAEALAGLLRSAEPPDARTVALRSRQVARLGLPLSRARDARRAVSSPRAPSAIAASSPEPVRPFLVEQLHLARLRVRLDGEGPSAFVDEFVAASGLDAEKVASARIEAAAQHGDHHLWFRALGEVTPGENLAGLDWQAVADQWSLVADAAVERVSAAVAGNLEAVVREIRETGELGQLLAKAAAGNVLTPEEKRKIREQLLDLAKAVPALAIFAAPGGLLLLPLLAKLLPFQILPSAWNSGARKATPDGQPAPAAVGPGPEPGNGRPEGS